MTSMPEDRAVENTAPEQGAPEVGDSFLDATKEAQGGLLRDFFDFMSENAKWWLLPFVIVFGLLGILLIFGSGAIAPFIYTLF